MLSTVPPQTPLPEPTMHRGPAPQTRPEHRPRVSYSPRDSAIGVPKGARYRMMSPAKLPISRSPCLALSPGFSPGALLDSPVLFNDTKAEASPTTGTVSFHSVPNNTIGSNSLCSLSGIDRNNAQEVGGSGNFEFKSQNVPDDVGPVELQHTKGSVNGKQALQCDNNGLSSSTVIEKSSEDGYNWRKYGQKHVKGCEFPRSYYKCTHSSCQVKKLLERSHDGQITEVIYKGQHDHPKPKPSSRLAFGSLLSGQGEESSCRLSSLASAEEKLSNAYHMDPHGNIELFPASPCDDDVEVGVGGSNNNVDEVTAADDPELKRRKVDNAIFDATQIGKTNREPRVVVQTISEVDILDDGYRWRKYGQKVVKGNPNPRSYYKCTNAGCSVRKHVERASHDPKAVITTYEGKHNHDVPAPRNSSHDTAMPMITTQMPTALSDSILKTSHDTVTASHLYALPEATSTISLDLGVGISTNHNSSSNGLCGSREGNAQGFSFRTSSLSSEHYYSSSGNLVMGP